MAEVFVDLRETLGQLLRARLTEVRQPGFQAILDRGNIHALGNGDYLNAIGRTPHMLASV